jgi:hypothetical protein
VQARVEADDVREAGHEAAERDRVDHAGVDGHDVVEGQVTATCDVVQVGAVVPQLHDDRRGRA